MRPTAFDSMIAAWVVTWVVLGILVGWEVHRLTTVTGSVRTLGSAVVGAGGAISGLRGVPLVGGTIARPGQAIAAAGRDAKASADSARRAGNWLAVLLGLGVALIPTVPVLLMRAYVRSEIRRALRGAT